VRLSGRTAPSYQMCTRYTVLQYIGTSFKASSVAVCVRDPENHFGRKVGPSEYPMVPRIGDAAELVANRIVNRIALSLPADLSSDISVALYLQLQRQIYRTIYLPIYLSLYSQ
jgi:hypothetical protein